MIKNNFITFNFFDNYTYYLLIKFENSTSIKNRIVFDESLFINFPNRVYFELISDNNYKIFFDKKIFLDKIVSIQMQQIFKPNIDIILNGKIINQDNQFIFCISINGNKENYYK